MTLQSDMLAFYKVIYAQRACDEAAAKIMLEAFHNHFGDAWQKPSL